MFHCCVAMTISEPRSLPWWRSATWLPAGTAPISDRIIPAAASSSRTNASVAISRIATGLLRSRVLAAHGRIASGSPTFASTTATAPSAVEIASDRACDRTIGSLATYTMRHSEASDWAMSWVLPYISSLVPMSRNCLIPASATR
jgi:hypothetical protein